MSKPLDKVQIEYGDFQTPLELTTKVCQKLVELGVKPDIVIEPTCGVGSFIEASAWAFPLATKIVGVEINPSYLQVLEHRKSAFPNANRIELRQVDFFSYNWDTLFQRNNNSILVLGNFPWVTNSQQSSIGGINLPKKSNFQNHNGLDALTGKSNFDISEWMLIQTVKWFEKKHGYLAMLCKTSVARKFLSYVESKRLNLAHAGLYGIDAKKYFNVSVDACLLVCEFASSVSLRDYDYNIYKSLESQTFERVGYRKGILVRDVVAFEANHDLYSKSGTKWRSGIKHDCSEVMEIQNKDGIYINGFGETLDIESTYLYPMRKGSDIANGRIYSAKRYAIVTQQYIGESTDSIKDKAPKTWAYLLAHAELLDRRKSRIYEKKARFSIFGVGPYTFLPWKIAICGLYKKLTFQLISPIKDKPIVFDDTVYFLSFETEIAARHAFNLLNSVPALEFLDSLIFWDEKRPIKTSVLNCLDLDNLHRKLITTSDSSAERAINMASM